MPLKLSLAVSRKVGQPDYGSLGASCGVELELAESLLFDDLDAFQRRVRDAYIACNQAVHDELARHQAPLVAQHANGRVPPGDGHDPDPALAAPRAPSSPKPPKPVTRSQVRAILAIANRKSVDLTELLLARFGVATVESLSITDASRLIDELQAAAF